MRRHRLVLQELVELAKGSKLVGTLELLDSYDDMMHSVRAGLQQEAAEQSRLVDILQVGVCQMSARCLPDARQVRCLHQASCLDMICLLAAA